MALNGVHSNSEIDRSVPGFSQAIDPMAGLSRQQNKNNTATDFLDVGDVYDGLADELEETGDNFNDDTFGDGNNNTTAFSSVGTGLDFFGRPLKVPDTITEDPVRSSKIQSPSMPSPMSTPKTLTYPRSGSNPLRVENPNYNKLDYVPEMLVDAKIWGVTPKRSASISKASPSSGLAPNGRKMMSVEELESAMLAQNKNQAQQQFQAPQSHQQQSYRQSQYVACQDEHQNYYQQPHDTIPQFNRTVPVNNFRGAQLNQPTHVLKRPQLPTGQPARRFSSQPNLKAQNSRRYSADNERSLTTRPFPPSPGPRHVMHPKQLAPRTPEEKAAFLIEEAKREKRNHKIFILSKDNGFMTPQDKNFITKIQLQQLISATGNPNEHGIDSIPAEDFYYQVHRRIRGGPSQEIGNPGSIQYSGWQSGLRRKERGSTHMQQMELQVQRAVEAAKNKPKYKKLVIEGSLGKISFSNSKAPKPLLIIKHSENGSESKTAISVKDRKGSQSGVSGCDRKTVLTDIENVYNTLMRMEDHDRQMPPLLKGTSTPELVDLHLEWQKTAQKLNQRLWYQLKVHEPIGATTTHPFIAFLSFGKGKKAIPRVFRHISHEQRTTILTMIVVHLDQLDVVRQAVLLPGETQLNAGIRENIEHFSFSVMPSLFGYLNETGLDIVTGILGLLLTINIDLIARTRIGVSMLTMILSRAELIKQSGTFDEQQEWIQWVSTYNGFFDALEPTLSNIFPGVVSTGEDIYVWQFLAAIGIGASPEQQQRLVMAVKDRVMETVSLAKTLPPTMSNQRLANVNLFMHSIGLDVGLLS